MAERILMKEFRVLSQEKWVDVQLHNDDIFNWDIALIVLNEDSMYYGGYFKAAIKFPKNYPFSPPEFRFTPPVYHPNIYPDGKLCISILHAPGEDEMSGELASERWSPAQRVESVLISILSLLDDAEVSSPANVDAAVMLRHDPDNYRLIVQSTVKKSLEHAPSGFKLPTLTNRGPIQDVDEDMDFWAESEVDSDTFGGSDSDDDMDMDNLSSTEDDDEDASEDADEETNEKAN